MMREVSMMFTAFYSHEALDLMNWAQRENNRIKASCIFKVAQSLEERFRKHHRNIVDDSYTRPLGLIPTSKLKDEIKRMPPPKPPKPVEVKKGE
jgi:hypothetical protein